MEYFAATNSKILFSRDNMFTISHPLQASSSKPAAAAQREKKNKIEKHTRQQNGEKTKILYGMQWLAPLVPLRRIPNALNILSLSGVGTHLHLGLNILLWLNQCELTHPPLFYAVCIFFIEIHKWIHFICVLFAFVWAIPVPHYVSQTAAEQA